MNEVDILENQILSYDSMLIKLLLIDRSKPIHKEKYANIIWASSNTKFSEKEEITVDAITGENGFVLMPRTKKTKEEQIKRSRDKAEVFTTAKVCNVQNNLIDTAWFGYPNAFNYELPSGWRCNKKRVSFPEGKTWQEYVKDIRLEVSCGEAPYLASRYDTITGKIICLSRRIGILDRKLRIVNENTDNQEDWIEWSLWAVKSTYGYEFQGDSLLIARENLLFTYVDYYIDRFKQRPSKSLLRTVASIISWNLWQMDGLKCVAPYSCHDTSTTEKDLFGKETQHIKHCVGCVKGNPYKHNGIYCRIKNWNTNGVIRFISLVKKNVEL